MAVMTAENIARNTLPRGFRQVPTEDVKAWALAQGMSVPTRQGRLSNAVIDGFNDAHKRNRRKYLPGGAPEKVTYTYTTAAGRQSTFEAVAEDVRAWALDKGLTKATRGRFSRAILDAYGQQVAKPARKRKAKADANEG